MNYKEQIKDPRWQRKRLEAMQADRFTCQICFHSDKPLNVHHKRYIEGAKAWNTKQTNLSPFAKIAMKRYIGMKRKQK